jgi:hypothetical protein
MRARMNVRAVNFALGFGFALTALPLTARADEEAARPYFTLGLPVLLTSLLSDTIQWGAIGTTSTTAHWAWHMVPGVGPIIGLTAWNSSHCGPGQNEPQCSVPQLLIQGSEIIYFIGEVGGLALVSVGIYKRTQPRFQPATAWWPRLTTEKNGATLWLERSF